MLLELGIDPLDCPGGVRRLINWLKSRILAGAATVDDRETVLRLLDWPDDTAERVEQQAWDDTQRSLANMGIQLDWDNWQGAQVVEPP